MSTIDVVVAEIKNPPDGEHPKGSGLRSVSLTLCPKDRRMNKRTKVIEPNVSGSRAWVG